jgi:succinyl-CoA synthetase beta subunit
MGRNLMELMTIIDKLVAEYNMGDAEQYISMVLDFSRKSVSLFVSNYEGGVETFLNKLIEYLKHEDIDSY